MQGRIDQQHKKETAEGHGQIWGLKQCMLSVAWKIVNVDKETSFYSRNETGNFWQLQTKDGQE